MRRLLVGGSALLLSMLAFGSTPAFSCGWGGCDESYYGASDYSYYGAPAYSYYGASDYADYDNDVSLSISYYAPPVYYGAPYASAYYAPTPAYAYAPTAYPYAARNYGYSYR